MFLKGFWKKAEVLELKVSWCWIPHWYLEQIFTKKWRRDLVLFLSTSLLSVQLCILFWLRMWHISMNQISLFLLNIYKHTYFFLLLYIPSCILKLSKFLNGLCVNFCFYKREIIQVLMCVKNLFHTTVVSSNNVNNFWNYINYAY